MKLCDFGERWGVNALYTDFRKMLRDVQPEIVSVCMQSPEKAEVTVAAAEAGVKAIILVAFVGFFQFCWFLSVRNGEPCRLGWLCSIH